MPDKKQSGKKRAHTAENDRYESKNKIHYAR